MGKCQIKFGLVILLFEKPPLLCVLIKVSGSSLSSSFHLHAFLFYYLLQQMISLPIFYYLSKFQQNYSHRIESRFLDHFFSHPSPNILSSTRSGKRSLTISFLILVFSFILVSIRKSYLTLSVTFTIS